MADEKVIEGQEEGPEQGKRAYPAPMEAVGGIAAARAEIEWQASWALAHPRDPKRAVRTAIAELEMYPDFAWKAYYSIPYAEKKGSEKKTVIQGPSIRAAMAMLRAWGNCKAAGRVAHEERDRLVVEGGFFDYETNTCIIKTVTVGKRITFRNGFTMLLSPDRLEKAIQAGISKATRNAILNGLPVGMVEPYFATATGIIAAMRKDRTPEVLQSLKAAGIPVKAVEAHFEGTSIEKLLDHQFVELVGILAAIEDGAADAAEVFDYTPETKPTAPPTGGQGPFSGPAKRPEPKPAEKAPEEPQAPPDGQQDDIADLLRINRLIKDCSELIGRPKAAQGWLRALLHDEGADDVGQVKDRAKFIRVLEAQLAMLAGVKKGGARGS